MNRGEGTGKFPPIEKDHPLAVAARDVNAYTEEQASLEAALDWLGLDLPMGELAFLCEQRALIGLANIMFGGNVTASPDVTNMILARVIETPLWQDMAPLLLALVMDGVAIGWKGREIADAGAT